MARERDQFAVARSALSRHAAAGRFGWGHPLVATSLAVELGLSPTPIREALAHLAGEGIIEHRPGRGYFAPSPTAADIGAIYGLHREFLRWSLNSPGVTTALSPFAQTDVAGRIEAIFDAVAQRGQNAAILENFRRVATRLRPVRRIEELLDDAGLETALTIHRLFVAGLITELHDAIDQYHDDRIRSAPTLEKVMRQSA